MCECEYKEQVNCKGYFNIQKLFWGETFLVKSCCENKRKEHYILDIEDGDFLQRDRRHLGTSYAYSKAEEKTSKKRFKEDKRMIFD